VLCRDRGLEWAAHITAIGELVTLPVVVLVSFLAQPRIQFPMAVGTDSVCYCFRDIIVKVVVLWV
jgi:hypothetical protein